MIKRKREVAKPLKFAMFALSLGRLCGFVRHGVPGNLVQNETTQQEGNLRKRLCQVKE